MKYLALIGLLALSACTPFPKVDITEPTTARPVPPAAVASNNGAIFQTASYRPMFEDVRARYIGDTLIIALNEKLNASKKATSNVEHKGDMSVDIPIIQGFPGKSFQGAALSANSGNKYDGQGSTESSNLFTGTITVTVTDVLSNGNLVVGGEKQIGISKNAEILRFTGVVNPSTIVKNTVSSTQVADARIDYRGQGQIDEAQAMGWLARFFLTFMPF